MAGGLKWRKLSAEGGQGHVLEQFKVLACVAQPSGSSCAYTGLVLGCTGALSGEAPRPPKLSSYKQGPECVPGNDRIGLAIHSAPGVHHQVSQFLTIFSWKLTSLSLQLTPISRRPGGTSRWTLPQLGVSLSDLHRDHCARQSAPGIGMKFCHRDKHCNLQHSPQIHLPPYPLACTVPSIWALPKHTFARSRQSQHLPGPIFLPVTGSIFFLYVSWSTCTLIPSQGWTSASIHVFSMTQSHSQLSPQILDLFVFLPQHFLWESGSLCLTFSHSSALPDSLFSHQPPGLYIFWC